MSDHVILDTITTMVEEFGIEEEVHVQQFSLAEWRRIDPSPWVDETTIGSWDYDAWKSDGAHYIWVREGLDDTVLAKTLTHELKHAQQGERMRAGEVIETPSFYHEILGVRAQAEQEAHEAEIHYFGEALTDAEFMAAKTLP